MARTNDPGGAPSSPTPQQRRLLIDEQFSVDFDYWLGMDPRAARRLWRMVWEILGDPFNGIGKPEPLRHHLRGCWSRRLTEEDRIVYRVEADTIHLLSARFHYPRHR